MKERGFEIRDGNYDRDTGFGDFNKQESGNVAFRNRDSGIPEIEICNENQAVNLAHLIKVGNGRTMT